MCTPAPDGRPTIHPETVAQWRAWLADNHATSTGVWVLKWKRHTGRSAMTYDDAVCEALAYGWIDSMAGTLDSDRSMQWYSPRRPASSWSRPNKERVARLLSEARMAPAGQRLVDLAHENGSWSRLDDVDRLIEPADLAAALDGRPAAREHWDGFPPSARKQLLTWVLTAKRPETRQRRITETVERAERGERANERGERANLPGQNN